jgi:two-component system, OmpR family, copper resistance phosphate regulon response regulator CusR
MSRVLVLAGAGREAALVVEALRHGGFEVATAADEPGAVTMVGSGEFDLLVLDLPGPAALGVLRRVREAGLGLPVLVLAGSGETEATAALEEGTGEHLDDAVDAVELLGRVRPRLRRAPRHASSVLRHGDLLLDLRTHRAFTLADNVQLTGREFGVLEALAHGPDRVVSREQLLSRVWGYHFDPASNLVEVYVRRLRRKLGPGWVTTVRGKGYRLERQVSPGAGIGHPTGT